MSCHQISIFENEKFYNSTCELVREKKLFTILIHIECKDRIPKKNIIMNFWLSPKIVFSEIVFN